MEYPPSLSFHEAKALENKAEMHIFNKTDKSGKNFHFCARCAKSCKKKHRYCIDCIAVYHIRKFGSDKTSGYKSKKPPTEINVEKKQETPKSFWTMDNARKYLNGLMWFSVTVVIGACLCLSIYLVGDFIHSWILSR